MSPETEYASPDNYVCFRGLGRPGLLGTEKHLTLGARRARVCLSCGYLLLFLSKEQTAELVAALRK